MFLSIVIPAYNEGLRLPSTLSKIHAYFQRASAPATLREVIVVDDGSDDATSEAAKEWEGRLPIRVLRLKHNSGKGAASRRGMLAAKGDEVLIYDADSATPIEEVAKLIRACDAGADIAIGSRLGKGGTAVTMAWHRRLIGRIYHGLAGGLTPGIEDAACGCKLFCRDVARQLFMRQRINRFAFDVEILWLALSQGYKVTEVPVRWKAVPASKVRLLQDGIQMFWCIVLLYARRQGRERRKERKVKKEEK